MLLQVINAINKGDLIGEYHELDLKVLTLNNEHIKHPSFGLLVAAKDSFIVHITNSSDDLIGKIPLEYESELYTVEYSLTLMEEQHRIYF
ncbi:hypothetical protein [Bacillus cereus]|uniref:hypothetical protein n=1 Tax=Bacillus cereus TaxID=1396 RepID=UPI000B4A7630|nr:hypothetical protein [Bacillus cereus]